MQNVIRYYDVIVSLVKYFAYKFVDAVLTFQRVVYRPLQVVNLREAVTCCAFLLVFLSQTDVMLARCV